MLKCFYCIEKLSYPSFTVAVIGSEKKIISKDRFEFCPKCFEYLFGKSIVFSTNSNESMACHMCNSKLITALPYSYFMMTTKLNNGTTMTGKRRFCTPCSKNDLFPVLNSLLIVNPKNP
jgi:hypothetical protein